MKKRNHFNLLGLTFAVLLPFLCIAFLQPVDTSKENCLQVAGIVEQLEEAGTKDIVFRLRDNPNLFYINRGLERGLTLPQLEQQLIGKKISLWHARSWQSTSQHIAHVQLGKEVIYSEWK